MDWWHTANLLAQQANLHRDKHKQPRPPIEFNPFAAKPKPRQASDEDLKRILGPDWRKHQT